MTPNEKRYNILSLDGASYKGIMTAQFVDYFEDRAYMTATRRRCIAPRASQKVSVVELFDMVAGSETGAIIASSLIIKNENATTKAFQPNKHFATTSLKFFQEHVDVLYADAQLSMYLKVLIFLALTIVGGAVTHCIARRVVSIPDYDKKVLLIQKFLRLKKDELNGKNFDTQELTEAATGLSAVFEAEQAKGK